VRFAFAVAGQFGLRFHHLDEGRRPEIKQAIGFLALGVVLVVTSIFVIKRNVQEPAEVY
jgi:hypothetical protein